jgi:Leucine-rich repeat (LRR) protein
MQSALSEYPSHLINPIAKNQALLSSKCYPYWQNFETIVEKALGVNLDYSQIRNKVEQLIYEIKDNEYKRDEARVKTENINIEMDFATIPKGTYKNEFIDTFDISSDIEIQTTPVTQYQWAKVRGDNPAEFKTGEDSRQVEVNGKKIEMCPNKPVENVSYEMITEYIKKLNEQDTVYEYGLPSIEEYLAVLGTDILTRGSYCLNKEETCHVEFSRYQYLGNKRIYSISDNVLEFTRDSLERNDLNLPQTKQLLFGLSYYSENKKPSGLTAITRPVFDAKRLSNDIGFRLIRYKKAEALKLSKLYNLIWDERSKVVDKNYIWDKTCQICIHKNEYLDWMVERKDKYSAEIQHTIESMLACSGFSIEHLKKRHSLDLRFGRIYDITPLGGLTNLEELYIDGSNISNFTPLTYLTNLKTLNIYSNIISDITPLARLTNLSELSLMSCKISDLTFMASFINIKTLNLYGNNISDVTPLAKLTNLQYLVLSNNLISNLAPLASLINLFNLDLRSNIISDIAPLRNLRNLMFLSLMNNHISDFTGLRGIRHLSVSGNPITDNRQLIELKKNGCHIDDMRT